ncbi:MAG TPA: hypothetical protein VMT76_12425 [Puia sp.]|nr:hypothetical protein [Puia sp.]
MQPGTGYNNLSIEELHHELKKQHGLFIQSISEQNQQLTKETSNLISDLIKLLDEKLRLE